jgi:glycosyltransferase involved in cell wall biosynthesis
MVETDRVSNARRLALFLPNLGGGGAERVSLAMIQGFLEQGYTVDLVLARKEGSLLPLVPVGVDIVDLGTNRFRQALRPLIRYLRERRPCALHAMMWPMPVLALLARFFARVDTRIIVSEHTTLSARPNGLRRRPIRLLTRRAYLKANGLVAVSTGVADDLSAYIGLPRDRITVIHNPLQLPGVLPAAGIVSALWPANTKRILAVGALKPEKNYPLLLRALAKVREHVPASLLILGEGQLRAELEQQIDAMALGDAVVLAGFDTDPWPYYRSTDVFVLSSDTEGLPTVLIEALHASVPIVSTDCPNGPYEILGGGAHGALTPCGDEQALATRIETALSTAEKPKAGPARAAELAGKDQLNKHLALMIGKP